MHPYLRHAARDNQVRTFDADETISIRKVRIPDRAGVRNGNDQDEEDRRELGRDDRPEEDRSSKHGWPLKKKRWRDGWA